MKASCIGLLDRRIMFDTHIKRMEQQRLVLPFIGQ